MSEEPSCLFNVSINTTKVGMTVRNLRGILLTTTAEEQRPEWEAEGGVYVETAFPWLLRGSPSVVKRCNFSQEPLEMMHNSNIFRILYYCNLVLSCGRSKHSKSSEWKSWEQPNALFGHWVHLRAFSHVLLYLWLDAENKWGERIGRARPEQHSDAGGFCVWSC